MMHGIARFARTFTLAAVLVAPLAACIPGPRLAASWYVTYCADSDGPSTAANPSCGANTAGDGVDDIHILIVNTGAAGLIGSVRLVPGNNDPSGAGDLLLTTGAWSKRLPKGGFVVFPMGAFPAAETNSRRCLIPVELLVRWNSDPRDHPIKVRGTLPTALPSDWVMHCSAAPVSASAPPSSVAAARTRSEPR